MTERLPGSVGDTVIVPGFDRLRIIEPTEILSVLSMVPSRPGVRVGNDWAEFSIPTDRPGELRPHEPVVRREPTLSELGLTGFDAIASAHEMTPSELAASPDLPFDARLHVPVVYIKRLYDMGMLVDVSGQQRSKSYPGLDKLGFAGTTLLVEPTSILGSFANGESSPRFDVYPGDMTLMDVLEAPDNRLLLRFYHSSVPELQALEAAFPMIRRSQ